MKNRAKKWISALLCAAVLFSVMPISAFADSGTSMNSIATGIRSAVRNITEDSSAFKVLELREGSLDGTKVVDLLNPSGSWEVKTNTDYYLYGEATHLSGNDYLQFRFGGEDGTANGVTFFNPPGGTYKPGTIDHDYLDALTAYTDYTNPAYGSGTNALSLQDGEMVYHVKNDVAVNGTMKFAMGMIVDDAIFNGGNTIEAAIQVAVGNYANSTFTAASSKTGNLSMAEKGSIKCYFNGTSYTASLDKPAAAINFYISEMDKNNLVSLLYQNLELDITMPTGAELANVGVNSSFVKTNSTYGTLTVGDKTVSGDTTSVHISISNGYRAKGANLSIYYQLTFPGSNFAAGQTAKTKVQNVKFTTEDGTIITPVELTSSATYAILDDAKDQTTMSAVNRGDLYNQTINGTTDYLLSLGSAYILNKNVTSPSPREKTYEASFNTSNTAANITYITVPAGTKATQEVILTGKTASGEIITTAVTKNISSATTCTGFFAGDYGMVSFTGVKAEIGQLRANYKTSSWTTGITPNHNLSGAFGNFTTAEPGIQVKNTFRLYNTDPSLRDLEAGDLTVSTTATSSLSGRVGYSVSTSIKNADGAVVDSIAAGESVRITGTIIPYSAPGAERKGTLYGNTGLVVDPVIFLTLPQGITYENLSFRATVGGTLNYSVENVSYLNTTGDGISLYKVSFPKGTILGYQNGRNTPSTLTYDIQLKTSKSMLTKRYEVNSLIGISTQNAIEAMPYSTNPATLATVVSDTYGLNNGVDYAGVAKGTATTQPGFGLQQLAEINVYNAVSVTEINGEAVAESWHAYDSSDPNSIASIGKNSTGRFRLKIENTSDAEATNLQILVPIPKAGNNLGAAFMVDAAGFDMSMTYDDADFTSKGFEVSYVTVTPADLVENAFITSSAGVASANAILLTCATVPAKENYEFYFNFTVDNGTANSQNIWRDVFQYTTSDGTTQFKTGSYVASAVAGGTISGTVYSDDNRNGKHDTDETGVSGISVVVRDEDKKIYSTITDENGQYSFLAVRESSVNMTFAVAESQTLRFNVQDESVIPAEDGLTATTSFIAAADNTVNAALSGFYSLTYQKNSGTGDVPAVGEYVAGAQATVAVKPDNLLRTGYVFREWNTQADGKGTGYQPGETLVIDADTSLYAIWEIGTYTITFNYRGATSENTESTRQLAHNVVYGVLPSPLKTGYVFTGWCSTSTGTTANVKSTTKFTLGTDTTLYAIWTPKENFGVDTDGDGKADYYKSWDESIVPDEEPKKNGYDFAGWVSETGEPVSETMTYGDLAESDATDTIITINPTWTPKDGYTVQYEVDGKLDTYSALTPVNWETANLLPTLNPTKANYAFAGWVMGGKSVTAAMTYGDLAANDQTQSITLTASWAELSDNTVHYDSNGGTVYNDKTGVKTTDSGLIPTTDPIKVGYSFAGWTEKISNKTVNSNTVYSTLSSESSITLVASWTAKIYTIRYDSGNFDSLSKSWAESDLLPEAEPEKAGSVFMGWYYGSAKVTNSTTIAQLIPSDAVSMLTLKASWSETTYTVVYESAGGTYYSPKTNVKYSATGLLPDTTPTRSGYSFDGWYAGNTKVTAATACSELIVQGESTITLTAHWSSKNGFSVVYNCAGGTTIEPKSNVGWMDTGLLPESNPTRTGYSFSGWVCGRNTVTNATAYSALASADTAGSSITLVAQWNSGIYAVVYDTDEGTSVNSKAVSWSSQNLLPSTEPKKTGFSFVGWTFNGNPVTSATKYSDLAETDDVTQIILVAAYQAVEISGGTTDGGYGTDVQGKVIEESVAAVYKVDLSWGAMKFVFNTTTTWNPDTHSYEQGTQGTWDYTSMDGSNNKITAANHSNGDVSVNFTVAKTTAADSGDTDDNATEDPFLAVTMTVNQENSDDSAAATGMSLLKVPAEGAAAREISAYLRLIGEPSNISVLNTNTYEKVGVITVTVFPAGGSLTPYER